MRRENIKHKLPALLPGSELKRANPNKYLAANLKGLAIAIVVRSEEQKVSKVRKRVWFTLWEKERKEAQEYAMRKWERNYRSSPHNYSLPDKKMCKPEGWGTRNWLKKSLFGEKVDWYILHRLIVFEVNQSPDHNCEWWCAVKDICEDITGFDPVAEILKISNEYAKPPKKPAKTGQEIKSVKKPLEGIAEKDRQLFLEIGADIKKHSEKYREAGKWLNKYYSIENFWQRREEELRTLKMLHRPQTADEAEKYKIEYFELMIQLKVYIPIGSFEFWSLTHEEPAAQPLQLKPATSEKIKSLLAVLDLNKEEQEQWVFENLPEYRNGDLSLSAFAFSLWKPLRDQIRIMKPPPIGKVKKSLERWSKTEKELPISYRFRDAQNALLWECWSKQLLSKEDAERVFLLTWIITDHEAEKVDLGVTKFENWHWNQGLRGRDFVYYETLIECTKSKERWMKLVRAAWAKLKAEKDLESEKPAETGRKEIVEVKPGAFGITVNIKEIAKRIWKCVCSRSKD